MHIKKLSKIIALYLFAILITTSSNAELSGVNKTKAWECSGIYMANYFLPSGENFEYSMKEKSMASVKVLKKYALETGILEKDWDTGVNKAVDKYYGSKYDKEKTEDCHTFLETNVTDGAERVKKVIQTLY